MTHKAIKEGDLEALKTCLKAAGYIEGKLVPKAAMDLLEQRCPEGKTCFFTAVEHQKTEIIDYLLETERFPGLNLNCKDTFEGDIPLIMAVRVGNHSLVRQLYDLNPDRCLFQNFKGHNAVFIATQNEDINMLEIFAEKKYDAL